MLGRDPGGLTWRTFMAAYRMCVERQKPAADDAPKRPRREPPTPLG